MKRAILTSIASVVAVVALITANVTAQTQDERTFMTFGHAVELPGVTLEPGTYLFKIANPQSSKNVVQVLSQDGKQVIGQWFFASATRLDPASDIMVAFKESPEGTPPAIQYWFNNNERIGKEFIYSKEQAARIAARARTEVLTADGRVGPEPTQVADLPVRESTASRETAYVPPARTEARPEPVGTSGVGQPETQIARAELPQTASPVPMIGIIGLLSLIAAVGIRGTMRRTADSK